MRVTRDPLEGLVHLHRVADDERVGLIRQGLAALASAVRNERRPVPLEGFDPDAVLASVRAAFESKLLEELDWLSPPAAAVALYELAAALPPSEEKRELGRRVLRRLHDGDGATFVALATQLALSSRRALDGPPIRARVALALDLPIGIGARADGLALALISRRDVEREWLTIPSTGSLPARRLAARLLERAAREAARRAAEGDDSGIQVFETPAIKLAWERLLADRESLVWRHVATARGLLAPSVPELAVEIERHTDAGLSPTEWRRAAASLAAGIAIEPDRTLKRCLSFLGAEAFSRDPGLAGAMIFGLPRAAEAQPDAVESLLERLVRVGGLDAAEALVELRRERLADDFGRGAAELARTELETLLSADRSGDEGRAALIRSVLHELSPSSEPSLRDRLGAALAIFAVHGAREAQDAAREVLVDAERKLGLLEGASEDTRTEREMAFLALRELDLALCETDALTNLLMLGGRGENTSATRPLGELFDRLTHWLMLREGDALTSATVPHPTLRLRRLRTMLHLVDADGAQIDARAARLSTRRRVTTRLLLRRVRRDALGPLRRALCATTARSCDALVREELAEVSDIVIGAGIYCRDDGDLETIAEASMVPDIESSLRAYARLERKTSGSSSNGRGIRAGLDALNELARELPVASSPRVEALRASLLRLSRALEAVASAGSLGELAQGTNDALLLAVERETQALAQLVAGAQRRLGDPIASETPGCGAAIRLIDFCLERALRGSAAPLADAIGSAKEALTMELPRAIAVIVVRTLERLTTLPVNESAAPRERSFLPAPPREAPLPPWMPPSRTLGGFYVVRALGSGAAASVFVAKRAEARKNARAEQFALKVPHYDAAAARTLSEQEFLQLFREEAGALLSLPLHPNIARFVTFDAGARPKPILVMELVEGPTLERLLEMGELTTGHALELLNGIAAGLEAMHAAGVAHLDIKPSNVILRDPDGMAGPAPPGAPVLVDFGLAGRKLRLGCGTAEYGAPEVWGGKVQPGGDAPMPADVYALACMTYELLTARNLFEGPHEMALITAHLSHDGMPPGVASLLGDPRTAHLGDLLHRCLRRNPNERIDVSELRRGLRDLMPRLAGLEWPIVPRHVHARAL